MFVFSSFSYMRNKGGHAVNLKSEYPMALLNFWTLSIIWYSERDTTFQKLDLFVTFFYFTFLSFLCLFIFLLHSTHFPPRTWTMFTENLPIEPLDGQDTRFRKVDNSVLGHQTSGYFCSKHENTIFRDIPPCSLAEVYWRFRGAVCLRHQGYLKRHIFKFHNGAYTSDFFTTC